MSLSEKVSRFFRTGPREKPGFRAFRLIPRDGKNRASARGSNGGRALLSMGFEVYQEIRSGKPIPVKHPAAWKNWNVARTLLDLGFVVDIIPSRSDLRIEDKSFDVTIDVRTNLEYLGTHLRGHGTRIYYPQFGHWAVHNGGQLDRHRGLLSRRGVCLLPSRLITPTLSVEQADWVLSPGGDFSNAGFRHIQGRIHPVDQAPPASSDQFLSRNMESARRNFVWIGGAGAVHKGLDLCLEAFAATPDLHLHVCGDIAREPAFFEAYRTLLQDRPNIHYHGWTDTLSDKWTDIAGRCAWVILHSASEVAATSPVAGMFTGLVPIVNEGADQRYPSHAPRLNTSTLDELAGHIREASTLAPAHLDDASRAAYEQVHANCTQEGFMSSLRAGICTALGIPRGKVWNLTDRPGTAPTDLPDIIDVTREYLWP